MLYKRLQDPPAGKSKAGSKWMHYGDPAAGQGKRGDIHYSVLCWSWLNARGGGMVRALVRDGQVFHRCDVKAITFGSWNKAGETNGEVVAVYGKTLQGNDWLFGWVIHSHRYDSAGTTGETVLHLEPRAP